MRLNQSNEENILSSLEAVRSLLGASQKATRMKTMKGTIDSACLILDHVISFLHGNSMTLVISPEFEAELSRIWEDIDLEFADFASDLEGLELKTEEITF